MNNYFCDVKIQNQFNHPGKVIIKSDGEIVIEEAQQVEDSHPTPIVAALSVLLPSVLATAEAMELWTKLQKAGIVDADYQPIGLSKADMMYIADIMADKLKLRYRWSPFEQFWQVKYLSQEKSNMQETGKLPKNAKRITAAIG